jgi:hypothetical protein
MERKYGLSGTIHEGIFFAEDPLPHAKVLRRINVEISRQNANLSELKGAMAAEARSVGATVIVNFRYGQKAHAWWEQLFPFKWDSESWHGSGDAVEEPKR